MIVCPHCQGHNVEHSWRVDMERCVYLDTYRCEDCNEHWVEESTTWVVGS